MNISYVVVFLIPATTEGVAELEALPWDGKPFAMVPFRFDEETAVAVANLLELYGDCHSMMVEMFADRDAYIVAAPLRDETPSMYRRNAFGVILLGDKKVPLGSQFNCEKVIGLVRNHLSNDDMPKEVRLHILEAIELQMRFKQNEPQLSKFKIFGD